MTPTVKPAPAQSTPKVSTPKVYATRDEIIAAIVTKELTPDEAGKLLDAMTSKGRVYCKVSQKGAVSVYGLQRMPVTLYVEQWERLLAISDDIQKFIQEHESEVKRKQPK